ncbi:MAG: ArnT family glycosyltransferase [Anaerolineae bacterium]
MPKESSGSVEPRLTVGKQVSRQGSQPDGSRVNFWLDRQRLAPLVLLSLLIAFHLVNNWQWRVTNTVVFGFDRIFHKVTSLAYYDLLREGVNLRTFFAALTWSDYYPPLVHLTAAGFYKLFGVSMDVAAMSTSLYLVILLLAVYGLGEQRGGPWIGLASAFFISVFPIVFSMSRYLYIDLALTAMVALNLCLLLRTARFQRKGVSLLYGVSLGLGLLTKWTFAAFAAAPLGAILTSSGLIHDALRALHPIAWNRRRLLLASLFALGLTALWFLPNIETTAALPLGYALVPLSWLIWTFTGYFVTMPGRGANLWSALGLGLGVASSWYLTKINFLGTFWLNAYGKSTGRSWGFGEYLRFLYQEQLSPIFTVLLLIALLGLGWRRWQHTRSWRPMGTTGAEGWVLVLWVIVPYLIFSSQVSTIHSRYLMPLLPPLALAIALWLKGIRPRWLRGSVTGLAVVAGLAQFAILSFDALAPLQARLPFLAQGLSIQWPATGRTDPGYWVAPDILQYVEGHRDTEFARLGVLVNSPQVNSKQLIYLAYTDYPHVQIQELATIGRSQPTYPRLFESDFILLIDPAPDYARRPDTTATIERILHTPDDTFHRAFELGAIYPLPDGTRLLLYQRSLGPVPEAEADRTWHQALMADLTRQARSGDALAVIPPELIYGLGRFGDGSWPIYPLSGTEITELERLGQEYSRIWLGLGDLQDVDLEGKAVRWLAEHFYRAQDAWYGPLQLVLYAPPSKGEMEFHPVQIRWDNGMTLRQVRFPDRTVPQGGIVRLDLVWHTDASILERYKVFVHLLDENGRLVSQRDSEPVDGIRPTDGWQPGELILDKYGLLLAPLSSFSEAGLAPKEYQITVGVYHSDTGERVLTCCPETDEIVLAKVYLEGDQARILPLE